MISLPALTERKKRKKKQKREERGKRRRRNRFQTNNRGKEKTNELLMNFFLMVGLNKQTMTPCCSLIVPKCPPNDASNLGLLLGSPGNARMISVCLSTRYLITSCHRLVFLALSSGLRCLYLVYSLPLTGYRTH